jgi:hypothetical protein
MKRIPCFMLSRMDSVVFSGRKRAVNISSEITGATNERAFNAKHQASPSLASAGPASAGPKTTAVLNCMDCRAMALGTSSFFTRVGINAA